MTSKLWVASSFPDTVATALAKTLADLRLTYVRRRRARSRRDSPLPPPVALRTFLTIPSPPPPAQLDLYLVHWPFRIAKGSEFPAPPENRLGYDEAAYAAVWVEMERAVDAGFTRAIGCSNMTARKLSALLKTARIRPAVNQCESHPFLAQAKEIAWLKAHGIAFTAYSPLGSPDRPARLIEESDPAPLHEPAVLAIAAKHGKEPAQVLIRWQVQRGVVVIPKSTTPARIASNIDVFSFDLDSADIEALAALDSGRRLIKGCVHRALNAAAHSRTLFSLYFSRNPPPRAPPPRPPTRLPWLWLPEQTWQSLWDEDFQY